MIQDFDLHMHTRNSDGQYTTKEIINQIKEKNIKTFSITDHDCIKSIDDIKNENIDGLSYISGVEISSILDGKYKMHILGYNIDGDTSELLKINEYVRKNRITRINEMASLLKEKYNIDVDKKMLLDTINSDSITIGKPHLAKILVKMGICDNVGDAIHYYLDNLDVKTSFRIDFKDTVNAIKKAGGKVIWAHPKKVENKYGIDMTQILDRMIELGLDGIEAFNALHSYEDSMRYIDIAHKKGLLISGGSDYHGPDVKSYSYLGVIYNSDENQKIDINEISVLK